MEAMVHDVADAYGTNSSNMNAAKSARLQAGIYCHGTGRMRIWAKCPMPAARTNTVPMMAGLGPAWPAGAWAGMFRGPVKG